ncbi:recombinase family protein [Amycolatopsis sp. H6(2020)]|nr:recombinase family protein [Amycolatopsis sp. H6(2020)]
MVSGAQQSRPGLDALLERLEPGDVVTVVRLDRLGRSMMHTLTLVARFRDDGVGFRSLRDGIDADTAAGRLMIGLLASIAEYERELIRERTTAGLRAARRPPARDDSGASGPAAPDAGPGPDAPGDWEAARGQQVYGLRLRAAGPGPR